ncbi:MAG: DUF3810 domain-containing protein [Clostridiales bacterium]|jgi:hypothetical protein|nr:DUF3810 domain-containing protein [Clostridiales bacterium]
MKKNILRVVLFLLYPVSLAAVSFAKANPQAVEKWYSSSVYPAVTPLISGITAFFGFSLAEIILVTVPVLLFIYLTAKVIFFIKQKTAFKKVLKAIAAFAVNVLCGLSLLYFLFIFLWGLNYYRPKLNDIAGFNTQNITVSELLAVCENLAANLNAVRKNLSEDENGVMVLSRSKSGINTAAIAGYENLRRNYGGWIKGVPKRAKEVILSVPLSYLDIAGIYIPHTAEPNYNANVPDHTKPNTVCHEQAHQLGFAREDEANFVSFLACVNSGDDDFVYSGLMLAFIHTSNALYRADAESYGKITGLLSESVLRDIRANNEFWKKYEGKASEISNKANDSYLKSNGQAEGVKSYGQMVDLVVAYYRE